MDSPLDVVQDSRRRPTQLSARRRRVTLIVEAPFAFWLARAIIPAPGPLFHQPLKLLALFGRQHGANLLPRFRQLFTGLRFEAGAQLAHVLLAIGYDLVYPFVLLGGEPQLPGENLNKFPVEEWRTGRGRIRRS